MNQYLSIEIAGESMVVNLSNEPASSLVISLISEDEYNKKRQSKIEGLNETKQNVISPITKFCFFIKEEGMFKRIDHKDIFYLKASGSYCELHTAHGMKMLACSLSHVHEQLNQQIFIRVHRSYAINSNYITRFCGNTCYIKDINRDSAIPISDQYHDAFFSRINVLMLNRKQNEGNNHENHSG